MILCKPELLELSIAGEIHRSVVGPGVPKMTRRAPALASVLESNIVAVVILRVLGRGRMYNLGVSFLFIT